jgi:hypothetical protein
MSWDTCLKRRPGFDLSHIRHKAKRNFRPSWNKAPLIDSPMIESIIGPAFPRPFPFDAFDCIPSLFRYKASTKPGSTRRPPGKGTLKRLLIQYKGRSFRNLLPSNGVALPGEAAQYIALPVIRRRAWFPAAYPTHRLFFKGMVDVAAVDFFYAGDFGPAFATY